MSRDLAIVGAGPAGVMAALWARAAALDFVLIESTERAGGQLHRVYSELVGVPGHTGNGAYFANALAQQLAGAGIAPVRQAEATGLASGPDGLVRIVLARQEPLAARAVLVATGLRQRRLDVPGERELEGRGVSTSATRDRERWAGQDVVVVGGGDAACENALLLAAVECPVTLIARGRLRARAEFRERIVRDERVTLVEDTRVRAILGQSEVRAVRLEHGGKERELETAAVFVKVGAMPNTDWCRDALAHDADGYLMIDARGATSRADVWAAGDVTRPISASVATAAAGAAATIATIRDRLRG